MGKSPAELLAIVRQKTSTENNQVVTDVEILGYVNETIRQLFDVLIGVDPSYYERYIDYTLTSSPTGAVAKLTGDFYKMRGLVRYPDTTREYPVFLVPFSERRNGKVGYTPDGDRLTVVPWSIAGDGPWRLYYTPKAPQFRIYSVRLCTAGPLPLHTASMTDPSGRTVKTLTATAFGALSVDATALLGDELILVNTAGDSANAGIYVIYTKGDAGNPWILVRWDQYDDAGEIHEGDLFQVTAGATLANTRQAVLAFGIIPPWSMTSRIDVDQLVIRSTTSTLPLGGLDVSLDNFEDYVTNGAALMVFGKRQMDPGIIAGLFSAAAARAKGMASGRASEPEQAPIMWRGRSRRSTYDDLDDC